MTKLSAKSISCRVLGALVVIEAIVASMKTGGEKASSEGKSFRWPVMGTIAEFVSLDGAEAAGRERDLAAAAFREGEKDLSVFAEDSLIGSVNRGEKVTMEADAFSTALFVLGEAAGREVLRGHEGCEALFVR